MNDRPPHPITLALPSLPAFLHLARVVTGSVAARLPLSVDAIDDLRLAVDEATTLLVRVVPGAARIRLELHPRPGELLIVVSALGGVGDPAWPPPELESSLPWRIISGLSDRAEVGESRDVPTIVIAKTTLSVPR